MAEGELKLRMTWLEGFAPGQVDAAVASRGRLEARFAATAKNGSPACSSIKLPQGWRPVQ